ncbi:hypothetical protein [Streptomyces huiliensis]|uniref:hypothetical protein n=1 Tax=Streptomyces huiliensis TaxID=2876027 RepID=UPI001CC0808F|nr:hypothetical protein [Streptomyces huiliensis]MBZ4322482.1 hypothetical protein [Streptomyces huiliensis]
MTTQNNATSNPPQGTYHWIITLELPGRGTYSAYGTWTPPAGSTRHDVFMALRGQITAEHPELTHANVVFFALEPNQL